MHVACNNKVGGVCVCDLASLNESGDYPDDACSGTWRRYIRKKTSHLIFLTI